MSDAIVLFTHLKSNELHLKRSRLLVFRADRAQKAPLSFPVTLYEAMRIFTEYELGSVTFIHTLIHSYCPHPVLICCLLLLT